MEKIIAKGTSWIKGLALLGMMVAMVGVFAAAPAASAATMCSNDLLGKISVIAVDASKGDRVSGATVAIYNEKGVLVTKGTTDAGGSFSTYSCTGTFKVKVLAKGYKEFAVVVQVSDNQTTTVKAGLQRSGPGVNDR